MNALDQTLSQPRPYARADVGDWRKEQLILAAIKCIAGSGVTEATIESISAEANVSRGLIRHYFKNKSGLMEAACGYLFNDYRRRITEAGRSSASPKERLLQVVEVTFKPPYFDQMKVSAWFSFYVAARTDDVLFDVFHSYRRWYRQYLLECFRELDEVSPIKADIDDAVDGFLAMTAGLWLQLSIDPHNHTPERAARICQARLAELFDIDAT